MPLPPLIRSPCSKLYIISRSLNLGAVFDSTNPVTFSWLPCRANSFSFFFFFMFPSPAKLPKWIIQKLMNTSVKSQLLKHLQVYQAHVTLTATVEERKMWTDADAGETSLQLLASNTHSHTEGDGARTNFHNSQMLSWILWVDVDDSVNPKMEQNRITSCLKFITHSWSYVLVCAWWWQEDAVFLLAFPDFRQQSQTMAIR